MRDFQQRHADQIQGVISCFDRIIIMGTLPNICYTGAMTTLLFRKNIRIFDYPRWAAPLKEENLQDAERLARENGLEIEFIHQKNLRKEDRIREILNRQGEQPGLAHIFSAMESCASFKPWHDKSSGKTH